MAKWMWAVALSVGIGFASSLVWAGQIVKKDGSIVYGQIVEETEKEVVIATSRKGMSMKMAIYRTEIASIDKNAVEPTPAVEPVKAPAPLAKGAVPSFYPLPMIGVVGKEITAATLKVGLGEARAGKAQYVVLVIDTPGGSIPEMNAILDVLADTRDMTVVAYVRRALSAGAMVAVACPKIVMSPDATIGAAVPWHRSPTGTPQAVAAKFESALEARCRSAAEQAGHSPLLAQGMIDMGLVLSMTTERGNPKVAEGVADGAKSLKPAGKILCMTAGEAMACGLSAGTAATLGDAKEALGIQAWHQADGRAWGAMAQKVSDDRKEQRYKDVKAEKAAKREEIRQRLLPLIGQLNDQLATVQARGRAAQDTLAGLEDENTAEIARVNDEYRAAAVLAGNNAAAIGRAREIREAKLFAIQQRYQPQFTRLEGQINSLNREQQLLQAKIKPLADELKKADQL